MKKKNLFLCIALVCVANAYAENDLLITPKGISVKVKSSTYGGDSVTIKSDMPTSFVMGKEDAEVLVLIASESKNGSVTIKNQYADLDFVFWAFGENYQLKPGEEKKIQVTRNLLDTQSQYKTRILSGNLYKPADE